MDFFSIRIPSVKMAKNATSADAISKFAMVEEIIPGYLGCSTYSTLLSRFQITKLREDISLSARKYPWFFKNAKQYNFISQVFFLFVIW